MRKIIDGSEKPSSTRLNALQYMGGDINTEKVEEFER
jgi:hypothetical protein